MKGALFTGVILAGALVCLASPPPGYELIEIKNGPIEAVSSPQINNCGEVVFSWGYFSVPTSEVFHYENGVLTQVTDNDEPDSAPDINDAGTMTWILGYDGWYAGEILLLEPGEEPALIGPGSFPRINNQGHIAWDRWYGTGCGDNDGAIFFYDGDQVHQITDPSPSDQRVRINDLDELAWVRIDFCQYPEVFSVMSWDGEETITYPSPFPRSRAISMNNCGQVTWSVEDGIVLWEDDVTTLLTDWGAGSVLNDQGDIFFYRWHDDTQLWQTWFRHHGGGFYQLTDDPFCNADGDINEYAEMVWRTFDPGTGVWGVRYLRRLRNGDTDFDHDVDPEDYAPWAGCLTGPLEPERLCECRFMDMDEDRDVDLADFALFQNARGPVLTPGNPNN